MADIFSQEERSALMANIKGKNTKIEKLVFSYLRKEKIYFQKHYSKTLGSPDIALPRKKRAVFIDGDFWHGWNIERRKDRLPIKWVMKIHKNVKRDRHYRRQLKREGWKILRVWEHELTLRKDRQITLDKITQFLTQ